MEGVNNSSFCFEPGKSNATDIMLPETIVCVGFSLIKVQLRSGSLTSGHSSEAERDHVLKGSNRFKMEQVALKSCCCRRVSQ